MSEDARETKMIAIAKAIDVLFNYSENSNSKIGFVLLVYEFDEGDEGDEGDEDADSRVSYVSNTKREDVLELLKTQVEHFEAQIEADGRVKS